MSEHTLAAKRANYILGTLECTDWVMDERLERNPMERVTEVISSSADVFCSGAGDQGGQRFFLH